MERVVSAQPLLASPELMRYFTAPIYYRDMAIYRVIFADYLLLSSLGFISRVFKNACLQIFRLGMRARRHFTLL